MAEEDAGAACVERETYKSKRAFFSFIEKFEGGYLNGAIALGYSIRKNSGYYPSENEPSMILMTMSQLEESSDAQQALKK